MKKDSSFKLKSGNKPSFAKLSGVEKSPAKKEGKAIKKKKELTPFEKAFAKARKEGRDTFMFEGKEYGTALKGEAKIYKAGYQKGTGRFNYVGPDGKITEFTTGD